MVALDEPEGNVHGVGRERGALEFASDSLQDFGRNEFFLFQELQEDIGGRHDEYSTSERQIKISTPLGGINRS